MPAREIERRLAELTPEKRALLAQLSGRLKEEPASQPAAEQTPALTGLDEEKTATRAFYAEVNQQLDATPFGGFSYFLNYGYVPGGADVSYSCIDLSPYYVNRNSAQLVLELIGDRDLSGKRVLDVGCGRGGTISVIREFFRPARTVGVDLSPEAIAFCLRRHAPSGGEFRVGDAEALPFEDSSFDVVTNVESSHCYPDVGKFYAEVFRILAPRGEFLYTDMLWAAYWPEAISLLSGAGFVVERDRDISDNVLLSCDEIARRRLPAYGNSGDSELTREFLAVPGSTVYEGLKRRGRIYRIVVLKKPRHGNRD